MRTRVIAWTDPDGPPDLDVVYEEGVSGREMAKIMQDYPCTSFALLEPIPREAADAAIAEPERESA